MSQQRIAADLLARAARLRSRALRSGGPRVRAQLEAEALKIEARARKMMATEAMRAERRELVQKARALVDRVEIECGKMPVEEESA
jgi:chemotaxis regulatin CheY-phosphate phosphatase CheZ